MRLIGWAAAGSLMKANCPGLWLPWRIVTCTCGDAELLVMPALQHVRRLVSHPSWLLQNSTVLHALQDPSCSDAADWSGIRQPLWGLL